MTKNIKPYLDLISKANISELNIEDGDLKLTLKKKLSLAPVAAPKAPPTKQKEVVAPKSLHQIKSPKVGHLLLNDSKTKKPLIKEKQAIKKGALVGYIETMKILTEIHADKDGTIENLLVGHNDVAEYGQPIIEIS